MTNLKMKRTSVTVIAVIAVLVLLAGVGCAVYLGDYYHADLAAIDAFAVEHPVQMRVADNGDLIWEPEHAAAGLIFYPGGKVEHTAYIPLMEALASENILCVIAEMPFHLAVFDVDAASDIRDAFPQIESWYIGGHSLGGSMAAAYLADCADSFEGLILLGSYSTADLSATELTVLSIYGSEDLVINREKYQQCRQNLPENFQEIVIDGGCHAYFGMYGLQSGDGAPTVANEAQIILTADAITAVVSGQAPDEPITNESRADGTS